MKAIIKSLHQYPLKSAGGMGLVQAEIGRGGFCWDRHWMLIDQTNRFVSQRQLPRMALLSTTMVNNKKLVVSYPGLPDLSISTSTINQSSMIEATMHRSDEVIPVVSTGEHTAEWFSKALLFDTEKYQSLRLVAHANGHTRRVPDLPDSTEYEVKLADGYPYLVASMASMAKLNDKLLEFDPHLEPMQMQRFRPNIVIDIDKPWAEMMSGLVLKNKQGTIQFKLAKPCQRCGIPQVNPATGEADVPAELHKVLKSLNANLNQPNNYFGQNAIVEHGIGKSLEVGMELEISQQI